MNLNYEIFRSQPIMTINGLAQIDEETPHIHCAVVPLVRKLDKRLL